MDLLKLYLFIIATILTFTSIVANLAAASQAV